MSTDRLMRELRQQLGGEGPAPAPAAQEPRQPRQPQRPGAQGPRQERPGSAHSDGAAAGRVEAHEALAVHDARLLERMKAATPAKVGVGRAGLRYRTETLLQFAVDFAVAKAAVESQVPEGWAAQHGWLALKTACADAEEFLARPDLGRRLDDASLALVQRECPGSPQVQIVVGDGLSAAAVMQNAPPMVQGLEAELQRRGIRAGRAVFVRHCRSKILDVVGHAVGAEVGIILVGERPGLGTGDGMSAYLTYRPHPERTDAEKQAVSNVHRRGLSPEAAGVHAANLIEAILAQKTSGVNLDISRLPALSTARPRVNQTNPDAPLGCGQSHGQQCENAKNGRPGQQCHRTATEGRPCETCRS